MRHTRGRRLLAGLAAAAAACAVATPAQAADLTPVDINADDIIVAALHGPYLIDPHLAQPPATITNPTYTYEVSGLTGVSLSDDVHGSEPLEKPCTVVSPTKLTCSQTTLQVGNGVDTDFMQARLTVADEAAAGQTGTLKVTLAGDDFEPITKSVTVKVADGVDLAAGSAPPTVAAKPGTTWNQVLGVNNKSSSVTHGVVLQINSPYAIVTTKQFANCLYHHDAPTSCTFDQDLQPGAHYQVHLPFQVRRDAYAPATDQIGVTWHTRLDWDDYLHGRAGGAVPPSKPGSGGKLTLEPVSAATGTAQANQTDIDPSDNGQIIYVKVSGKNGIDLAAVGAKASGEAGSTVTVPVGVHNNGPATLDRLQRGPAVTYVHIPRVTPVVSIPAGCTLGLQAMAKHGTVLYDCRAGDIFPAHSTVTWPFRVKIGNGAGTVTGTVEVSPVADLDPQWGTYFSRDTNSANNIAKIVITEGTHGQGGDDGGSLPITGPRTALLAGVGAALIAFGALFLIRRRRTRFEA